MSPADNPLPLSTLLSRYLQQQAAAQAAGLGGAESVGEVEPFEAVPVQPVEPQLAWQEAVAALGFFHPATDKHGCPVPPDWSAAVMAQEPAAAVPFCLGNFPQMVRRLHPLLRATDFTKLRPAASRRPALPALVDWAGRAAAKKEYPQALLALGSLRLAQSFDLAAELLAGMQPDAPPDWRGALANEQAALAWHRGQAEEALNLWQGQSAAAPVHFNRGMAALFLGRPAEARPALVQAVGQIPQTSGWHHLGRLYLALAETASR